MNKTIAAIITAFLLLSFRSANGLTGPIERVSVDSSGVQANDESDNPVISPNGRYIVFESYADNLVEGDTNNSVDVFIHDLQADTTKLISVASNGDLANSGSNVLSHQSLSSDGRYVVFFSDATNLGCRYTTHMVQVYVHDNLTGETTCESIETNEIARGQSLRPSISGDGRYVAFDSNADDLVPGDTNGYMDVFVRDRVLNITKRVSIGLAGVQGNEESDFGIISPDGRFVAFESTASNLVTDDTNGKIDIFLFDMQAQQVTRVSVNSNSEESNGNSHPGAFSADSRYFAFYSNASNLVPGDMNNASDVFLLDRDTGLISRLSLDSSGLEANSGSMVLSISGNGRFVAFSSRASNLVAGDTNEVTDVFIRDVWEGTTILLSKNALGIQGNSTSDTATISADGSLVSFISMADNLVADDKNGSLDVFVVATGFPPNFEIYLPLVIR
jgi:Tol biopolymer transport system component